MIDPKDCLSTHGGSGYAPGSYWDGDDIICGICGHRIENPAPTGGRMVKAKGLFGILKRKEEVPTWPSWIKKKGK